MTILIKAINNDGDVENYNNKDISNNNNDQGNYSGISNNNGKAYQNNDINKDSSDKDLIF